ncbi:MAG: MotA/TolQ/ExbB proton channel family protein [Pseudomonadales bacterium]|jgi:biopolymer transport protein ExbB|nr:energy transducer TonB [Gammaproteobacteria bacterium]MDP6315455.1 MotA/TolQ/ExbB proton channel family protein [Pseudomonadales bacterium]
MKKLSVLIAILGLALSTPLYAADEIKAATLSELLQMVKEGKLINRDENNRREKEFADDKARQQSALKNAERQQREEEARSERLETQFEKNEKEIAALQEILSKRLGSLRELFGVLQQVSGDTQGVFEGSIISAEYPGRTDWLAQFAQDMGKSSKLATIEEIERLWFEMQREMTESGKITRFTANVNLLDGSVSEQEVVRVGAYSLISGGQYVTYDIDNKIIKELPVQPPARFENSAAELQGASSGFTNFGIDPTKGTLLELQVQIPSIEERINQGGTPGYVIIGLGIIALLLSVERFATLTIIAGKVKSQIKSSIPTAGNPLGRVLQIYDENKDVDPETLALKLDEAILKEQPAINARIAFIKIISMVAPLLGLLGTVIGMIVTFQAITLFGTGDPKTMANGISQALMTTVMGLCVAIPTVLLHSIVQSRSNIILHILNEQSAGLIAQHAEEAEAAGR